MYGLHYVVMYVYINTHNHSARSNSRLGTLRKLFPKRASKNCQSINSGGNRGCGFVCLWDLQVNSADLSLTMKVLMT